MEGVKTCILCKKLFRRSTRGTSEGCRDSQQGVPSTARDFGNTVKGGRLCVSEADLEPINVEGGEIEHVNEFQCLGPVIAESGRIDAEVDRCIENASKAFGARKEAVLRDCALTINTKRMLYHACLLVSPPVWW